MLARLLWICLLLLPVAGKAQTADSVIVSGQVRRLSARLYRQSPNVLVTRTNLLRGGIEQAFTAPLQADGTFRVAVPIIYPQEEMQFVIGNAATAFLASAGQLTINLDNDSLYVAAIPFQFGGVNAQVNQQFAQYKAFAAKNKPNDATQERTIRRALRGNAEEGYATLYSLFKTPFDQFVTQQTGTQAVFPLVQEWANANARNDAAAYIFDKGVQEQLLLSKSLVKTLTTSPPQLLTSSRATALSRFGAYAAMRISQYASSNTYNVSVPVRDIARLIEQYGANLTRRDRERLAGFQETNTAKTVELRYLSKLLQSRADTLNRLLMYQNVIQTARPMYDSSLVDYMKGYLLQITVPDAILNTVQVLEQYIYPKIGDPYVKQSVRDYVGQALSDSTRVRRAWTDYLAVEKQAYVNTGAVSEGTFVTVGTNQGGNELLDDVLDRNRGRVVCIALWAPGTEESNQRTRSLQRLRDAFPGTEFTLLYVSLNDDNDRLWLESIVRNRLRGEHIRLSQTQTNEVAARLSLFVESPYRLVNRKGKVITVTSKEGNPIDQLIDDIQSQLR